MKLLVIEDSERLRRSLGDGLAGEGHSVDVAADGEAGLAFAETYDYDVIILDLMLPKLDGLCVLSRLRRAGRQTQILILSARDQTDVRIRGLDLGADDYMVKPFAFDELTARLRALSRRAHQQKDPDLDLGPLLIDTNGRRALAHGRDVRLSAKEYGLVEFLARSRGRVRSKEAIIQQLYRGDEAVESNVIEALVHAVKRKLAEASVPSPIRNLRGQGYFID